MSARVVIVGAGILGTSTAYHLRKLGERRVLVIDRRCLSAAATGRSGALVRANYDNEADAKLALMSLDVFRNWEERVGGSCGFTAVGHLEIADAASAETFRKLVECQRQWGVAIRLINSAEAKSLAPRVRFDDADGPIAYEARAGYCDPNLANRALYDVARADGVEFIFDEAVRSVVLTHGRAIGLRTNKRFIPADAIVLAPGAWTNQILAPLGLDFGLISHLSRLAVFRPHEIDEGETFPTIIDHVHEAWFRPMPGGCVLVGAECGGRDGIDADRSSETVPPALVASYRRILAHRFAVSAYAASRGAWAGAYMLSPDRRPVVGKVRAVPNLFLAAGDSGTSFKIAPAIGLGLAELIVHGASTSVDLTSLAPGRFDARAGAVDPHRVSSPPNAGSPSMVDAAEQGDHVEELAPAARPVSASA